MLSSAASLNNLKTTPVNNKSLAKFLHQVSNQTKKKISPKKSSAQKSVPTVKL